MSNDKQKAPLGDLTDVEWCIMKVLWEHEPCTAGTVQEILQDEKNWAYSTIKTTMDRMVKKGLLKIRRLRNLQLFSSTINQTAARKGEFRRMLSRAFDGAIGPLMEHLIENEPLSEEDITRLRALVEKHK